MLRLASDADVNGEILRGLRRRLPEIDLVRAQDVLTEGTPDPEILAWAAGENRVLITTTATRWWDLPTSALRLESRCRGSSPRPTLSPLARPSTTFCFAEFMPEEVITNQIVVYLPFKG